MTIAVVGIGIAASLWFRREELGPFRGLTQRNAFARRGYTFLENKYYLDHLYENVIVDGIRGGVARALLLVRPARDRRRGQGRRAASRRGSGGSPTTSSTSKGVDGAINGMAAGTGDAGSALRTVQSGRVQRYALLLFAAVGLLSLAVYLVNTTLKGAPTHEMVR